MKGWQGNGSVYLIYDTEDNYRLTMIVDNEISAKEYCKKQKQCLHDYTYERWMVQSKMKIIEKD